MQSLKLRYIDANNTEMLLDYDDSVKDEIVLAMLEDFVEVTLENDTKIVAVETSQ